MNVVCTYLYISLLMLACLLSCNSVSSSKQKSTSQRTLKNEVDSIRTHYNFPGITVAYVIDKQTSNFAVSGMADIENNVLMNENSRMLAASIGKTFTSATVLNLVAEGMLDLDTPISKWIGYKKWFTRLPAYKDITLRNLLNHSSGIPNHVDMEAFGMDLISRNFSLLHPPDAEKLIAYIFDKQALFPVGTSWAYSDTGYLIIGLIIEEVTGKSFFESVQARILNPLNLKMTSPSNRIDIPNLAAGYLDKNNEFGLPVKTTSAHGKMVWNPAIESAGGGFVSSSSDLAKWGKLLFEGKALKGDYLEEMLKGIKVNQIEDLNIYYGLGASIYEGTPFGKVYGHAGWIPGYCSSLRYYPKFGLSVAFQINTDIDIQNRKDERDIMNEIERRLVKFIIEAEDLI